MAAESEVTMMLDEIRESCKDGLPKQKIVDGFERLVSQQGLRPGDRLPSTSELASRLEVALTTVQAAMRELSEKGVVVRKPRVGTIIRNSSSETERRLVVYVFANLPGSDPACVSDLFHIEPVIQFCRREGFEVALESFSIFDELDRNRIPEAWKQSNALLFISPSEEIFSWGEGLAEAGLPVIFLNAHSDNPKVGNIYSDNYTACYNATVKLLENGHRRVAMLFAAAADSRASYHDRIEGCRKALREAGAEGPEIVEHVTIQKVASTLNKSTAIIDCGVPRFSEILELLEAKVPEKISVISYDNTGITVNGKQISAIVQPIDELLQIGLGMLHTLKNGGFQVCLPQKIMDGETIGTFGA